jgi:hypothetical protein
MGSRCFELFVKAKANPRSLRFAELKTLCQCAGLQHDRTSGSHLIFRRNAPFFLLSIQRMPDGRAKPYQVRQLIELIETHKLIAEE